MKLSDYIKLNLSNPYGKFEAKKPKARFINGLWVVWDGVSFANGFGQGLTFEQAYSYYISGPFSTGIFGFLKTTSRDYNPEMTNRLKAFWEVLNNETKR